MPCLMGWERGYTLDFCFFFSRGMNFSCLYNNNNNNRFIWCHIHGSWRFTVRCFKNKIYISDKGDGMDLQNRWPEDCMTCKLSIRKIILNAKLLSSQVTGVVGRADVVACFLFLLSFLAFVR